jgi:hypothetical protein
MGEHVGWRRGEAAVDADLPWTAAIRLTEFERLGAAAA